MSEYGVDYEIELNVGLYYVFVWVIDDCGIIGVLIFYFNVLCFGDCDLFRVIRIDVVFGDVRMFDFDFF